MVPPADPGNSHLSDRLAAIPPGPFSPGRQFQPQNESIILISSLFGTVIFANSTLTELELR